MKNIGVFVGTLSAGEEHTDLVAEEAVEGMSPYHSVNETIRRALVSGSAPSVLEPVSVCREDARRSDGMTLIVWEGGKLCFGISHVWIPWHPPINC